MKTKSWSNKTLTDAPSPSVPSQPDFIDRIIRLFEDIHPLDRIPRSGYLLRGVPEPESVAAHSHFMALMTLLFVQEYPERFNAEKALALALIHDLSEARILDIPMPYADAYLSEAKRKAEQSILEELLDGFNPELAELHKDFEERRTEEAKLLRGLDKAQMMLKILCYDREHKGNLAEFWVNPKNFRDYGIEPVSDLFDAICERAGKKRPR
jgi:putative hydrolase of HD superfamily